MGKTKWKDEVDKDDANTREWLKSKGVGYRGGGPKGSLAEGSIELCGECWELRKTKETTDEQLPKPIYRCIRCGKRYACVPVVLKMLTESNWSCNDWPEEQK